MTTSTEVAVKAPADERSRFSWVPTSMAALERAEAKLLSFIKTSITQRSVAVLQGKAELNTISVESRTRSNAATPLVMLHGFASGVGLWAANLTSLSRDRTVYAMDLLGFGRSTRFPFSRDPLIAEEEWVQSLEDWRSALNLDKFILLGHSLGGFLAGAYALKYPEHVRHLILVDPWGFPIKPSDADQQFQLPAWVRVVASVLQYFNPLASVRAAGPFGPSLIRRFRPDIGQKYSNVLGGDMDSVFDYIYHCNAQSPSGETAFKSMQIPFGWSKHPMIDRLPQLREDVPMTFIYGRKSWINFSPGFEMKMEYRPNSYVDVQILDGAGHHVYVDRGDLFNELVERIGQLVDTNKDRRSLLID